MAIITHQHHGHEHDGTLGPHTHLTSVGIDIGSSTSHLMFSQLMIGYPSLHQRRPQILERRVIARSPILLTPFSGNWNIEAEPLRKLVDATFDEAGLNREQIDTGAVIVTGEAARRENAQKIAEIFSDEAGRFVCATAGPKLESVMAAHGSGAVLRSREEGLRLLNIDVGGGTTKVSLIDSGRIVETTAVNIGARLIAHDQTEILTRLETGGRRFLRDLGHTLNVGGTIDENMRVSLAARMAHVLFDTLAGEAPPWQDLYVTAPLAHLPEIDGILFSGGVSEYIYGREQTAFGDLGPQLGRALKTAAEQRGFKVLDAGEGIRATVIGASQYTVQLSGETIYVPQHANLPVHNLRVFLVRTDWNAPVAKRAAQTIEQALKGRDPEVRNSHFALAISTPPFLGYGAAQELAKGIDVALSSLPPDDRPQILVFEQNVARVVGGILGDRWSLPCVDEISLSELDFIDIGEVVKDETFVPVVVKSLAFGV